MKDKLLMIVFVLVLGTILSTSLVVVNHYTAPIIAKNEEVKLMTNVLDTLGINYAGETVEKAFKQYVTEKKAGDKTVYVSTNGDVAIPFAGNGLWGPITGIMALKPNLTDIKQVNIMHQEETPGLGSRIADQPFLHQFLTRAFTPVLTLVKAGQAKAPNQVDGITGATLSSRAFVKILNDQYKEYRPLLPGGNK